MCFVIIIGCVNFFLFCFLVLNMGIFFSFLLNRSTSGMKMMRQMFNWILMRAQKRYKDWKYQCHKANMKEGPSGMPSDFIGRENQWEFICSHFESDEFKVIF